MYFACCFVNLTIHSPTLKHTYTQVRMNKGYPHGARICEIEQGREWEQWCEDGEGTEGGKNEKK